MTRHVLITRSLRGVGWHSVPAASYTEAVDIARRQHVENNGGEADGVEVKTPILTPNWTPMAAECVQDYLGEIVK